MWCARPRTPRKSWPKPPTISGPTATWWAARDWRSRATTATRPSKARSRCSRATTTPSARGISIRSMRPPAWLPRAMCARMQRIKDSPRMVPRPCRCSAGSSAPTSRCRRPPSSRASNISRPPRSTSTPTNRPARAASWGCIGTARSAAPKWRACSCSAWAAPPTSTPPSSPARSARSPRPATPANPSCARPCATRPSRA